ncbi:uncharacterized protein LOC118437303 [Folsomia candida]|uniref:uncharacterized protein LOC118437303 n=1 Tax=Folsomia candida TaxID=158441 RepID=UPI001605238E|nr:uncharacterized protein LOC118437303 [Folsomia candida]
MYVCDKFSNRVEILDLSICDERCLPSVCQVLKNRCPNLKQLRIDGDFTDACDVNLFQRGEEQILPLKPNLTLFTLTCYSYDPKIQFVKTLANVIQLVVNASPNLREVTIPWGFYPNLANSKCLESLHISLNEVDPYEIEEIQNDSRLSDMLHQVNDQLVGLSLGTVQNALLLVPREGYDFGNSSPVGFHLARRMPKLRKFSNRIVEMFRCSDFLQNIEMMPFLETLVLGRDLQELRGVDEILRRIFKKQMILPSVRKLKIIEVYDPKLLDGVATAFPNVERLEIARWAEMGFDCKLDRLEVNVVLEACRRWNALKRLTLTLSKYPVQSFSRGCYKAGNCSNA